MKVKIKESDILKQARDYLEMKGWFVIRVQQGLVCHKGISGLIAVKNGKTYFIEIKVPGGILSEYQKNLQKEIWDHGGEYIVIDSMEDLFLFKL